MPAHNQPFISVIMPCYNSSAYIQAAIESIKNQQFLDWELIVIDDGSTDASWQAIASMQQTDKRISCIQNQHQGVSAARNAGLKQSKGLIVSYLDADNTWRPDYLLSLIHI